MLSIIVSESANWQTFIASVRLAIAAVDAGWISTPSVSRKSCDAFEEFVNLREVEIWGYVEGVERSLGTVATLDIDWKDPAELAEHLKSGSYVEIKRAMSWRDWN